MKIAVIGYSGSGKSTLSEHLGHFYNCPVLFLDKVYFTSGWQKRNTDEAKSIVSKFMRNKDYIIDGNYTALFRGERLEQADKIVFLSFNRITCLIRVIKRYFEFKNKVRASAADGCIEKLDFEFIRWVLHDGRTKSIKDSYKNILNTYSFKTVVIKNQKQLDALYNITPINYK